jgi:hypothetical protein
MKKAILDFLEEKALTARLEATFHAGAWSAYEEAGAFVSNLRDDDGKQPTPTPRKEPAALVAAPVQEKERVRTARPALDLLRRAARPLAAIEVARMLRREGHDVSDGSVRKALVSGVEVGALERIEGGKYQVAHQDRQDDH